MLIFERLAFKSVSLLFMQKPKLSDEQKLDFEKQFHILIESSSQKVKDLWKEEGEIRWTDYNIVLLPKDIEKKICFQRGI